MKSMIIAAAIALGAVSAVPAQADIQERNYNQDRGRDNDRDRDRGRDNDSRYGRWDNSWGARPSGPPRGWTRQNDWYRHVRACQMRYRSYDPRTDMYVSRYNNRRAVYVRCRL
jgi:hypothetical protein